MFAPALTSMQRHSQVVMALAVREIRTRYSADLLGFGWALLTPAAWIVLLVVAFHVLGRAIPIHTDPVSFILSGVIPYLVFRSSITAITRTRGHYRTLIFLGPVSRAHISAALSLLELISALLLYALVMLINSTVTGNFELHDPIKVMAGLWLAWLFGFSLGSLVDELAHIHVLFSRLAPVLLRPFFLISGVFFAASEIPLNMLGWLDWNPLLHAIDLLREGMFVSYHSPAVNVPYMLTVNALLFALALLARRRTLRS